MTGAEQSPENAAWRCDGCDAEKTGKCAAVANPEDCSARRRSGDALGDIMVIVPLAAFVVWMVLLVTGVLR